MSELKVGSKAPEFQANNQKGQEVSLKGLAGKTVVLFFYPKDMTPGCTTEACSFRDHYAELRERGVMILGISPDNEKSHQNFIEKHSLPYDLIVDTDHKIAESYNVWVEKSMYGKKYMGVERSTFVIDPTGSLQAIFRKVKPEQHVEDLLKVLV